MPTPVPRRVNDHSQHTNASHWASVWSGAAPESKSWFESSPSSSLALIEAHAVPGNSLVDIGGGASPLAYELHRKGFADITVLDISEAALDANREHFKRDADQVAWVVADIIDWSPNRTFGVWHDRAAFHFLITESDVARYVDTCAAAVEPGGILVLGTFGPNGPESCSGLPVRRRTIDELNECFAAHFVAIASSTSHHITPQADTQEFVFIVAHRRTEDLPDPRSTP